MATFDPNFSVENALAEYVSRRHCGIAFKVNGHWHVGTGGVVKLNNRAYLATCKHVADGLFSSPEVNLLLEQGGHLSLDDITGASYTDDIIDQALLEVPKLEDAKYFYSKDDFDPVANFDHYDIDDKHLFVYGYPSERAEETDLGYLFGRFGFLARRDPANGSSGDRIVLSYPIDTDSVITQSGKNAPNPGGMSGGFILTVPRLSKDVVWSPTQARVVAMQYAWNQNNRLFGSSARHLLNLAHP